MPLCGRGLAIVSLEQLDLSLPHPKNLNAICECNKIAWPWGRPRDGAAG
jgi:hypothetical protein